MAGSRLLSLCPSEPLQRWGICFSAGTSSFLVVAQARQRGTTFSWGRDKARRGMGHASPDGSLSDRQKARPTVVPKSWACDATRAWATDRRCKESNGNPPFPRDQQTRHHPPAKSKTQLLVIPRSWACDATRNLLLPRDRQIPPCPRARRLGM